MVATEAADTSGVRMKPIYYICTYVIAVLCIYSHVDQLVVYVYTFKVQYYLYKGRFPKIY